MLLYFTAVSAIVPSILLLWWFRARDVQPEPMKVLLTTFALGVATVVPVLMVALPLAFALTQLGLSPAAHGTLEAFVTAAGPEEFFKFLVVALYAARHKEFDEPMDGVVYGAVASLGFATLENVLYVSGGGLGVALMRAITAVPGHAFTGAIMGYYVGQAKFDPANRGSHLLKAYFVPFLLHGLYDAPLLAMKQLSSAGGDAATETAAPWLVVSVGAFLVEWVLAVRVSKRLRLDQLRTRALALAGVPRGSPLPAGFVLPSTSVPKPPGALLGAVLLFFGVLLASVGGLVVLGMLLATVNGDTSAGDATTRLVGTLIVGVLPLVLGLASFGFGVRRLARSSEAVVRAMAAPYAATGAAGANAQYAPR